MLHYKRWGIDKRSVKKSKSLLQGAIGIITSLNMCPVFGPTVVLGIVLTSGCATSRHCQQQELPGVNIHCCETDLCNTAPCWHPGILHYICMLVGLMVLHLWRKMTPDAPKFFCPSSHLHMKPFTLYALYYIPIANQGLKLKDGHRDYDEFFFICWVSFINMSGKKILLDNIDFHRVMEIKWMWCLKKGYKCK